MKQLAFLLAIAALACPGLAQNHVVSQVNLLYVDSVSLTSVTTVTLGTTIEWTWSTGNHSVTSGTGSSDPASGNLFDACLDALSTTFTWTPPTTGTFPYYCIPHEAMGHNGTIIVVPPPPTLPGTGEDVQQATAVNSPGGAINPLTTGGGFDMKSASAGDAIMVQVTSPGGTLDFTPITIVAQLFTTGAPTPVGPLPGLHITTTGAVLLLNPFTPPLGLAPIIAPGGSVYSFITPPGLSGNSTILQTLALTSGAANGFFATSSAHQIQFQ